MIASKEMQEYFESINKEVKKTYDIASLARKKGLDPEQKIEIPLARNMAERVEGLISIAAPEIIGKGIPKKILELEQAHGKANWRVALTIALEVAQEKFCKFESKMKAIETGLRIGFAYVTIGVVSSPLEGFVAVDIKKRLDNQKEFFSLRFGGPVRSAGGTAASAFLLIADYIRKELGYSTYDATEQEIKRSVTELTDYHERITNLQYFPSEEEITFMIKNIPIMIDGDPSEKIEVSNYKNLSRIEANKIRNGFCLVVGECICQKAPKVWKQLEKWGKDFGMQDWDFLEDFVKLQKKIKAKGKKETSEEKIKPDHTFIKDLVAGRPVLTHPLAKGGFRLRYGRARNTGLSAMGLNPATMIILDNFIATGTQLKVERPGKSTVINAVDTIEGPIVKLKNQNVVYIENKESALKYKEEVEEILFLGDLLVNHGDFLDRAHVLAPPGYCEEYWTLQLEKKEDSVEKISKESNIELPIVEKLLKEPLITKLSPKNCFNISKQYKIPLHPKHTIRWTEINHKELLTLFSWLSKATIKDSKIILPIVKNIEDINPKRVLEKMGLPHSVVTNEYIVIEDSEPLKISLGFYTRDLDIKKLVSSVTEKKSVLEIINSISEVELKDKSGLTIGARMGRPEKAKIRKLTGSPHVLFPVGEEGGRLRCFQSALEAGKVSAEFPIYLCNNCNKQTIYPICHLCKSKTTKQYFCIDCNKLIETKECKEHRVIPYKLQDININEYFDAVQKDLKLKEFPALIKGIRGTSNKDHTPENLIKGILRAIHNVSVNKDGTIRYDMTETPITHFKPKEIGTSIKKLKEIGYKKDIYNEPLISEEQIIEIKAQDIILPACLDSFDEPADIIFYRTTKFIDDLLKNLYSLEPFYNLKNKEDLVGHLVISLAPHTSAGTVSRIIGFSKTQGFYAHPLLHCAVRRDCFDYDTFIPLKKNRNWRITKIGKLVEELNPKIIVDSWGTKEKKVSRFETIGLDKEIKSVRVKNLTKHTKRNMLNIKTSLGKKIKVTENHKFLVEGKIKKASYLKIGDKLPLPIKINIKEKKLEQINIVEFLKHEKNLMIRGIRKLVEKLDDWEKERILNKLKISKKRFTNYKLRDSYPLEFILRLNSDLKKEIYEQGKIAIKRDNVEVPIVIMLDKELLEIIGLYIAEGYSRSVRGEKGLNQVYIASNDLKLKKFIEKTIFEKFGLKVSEKKKDRVTFSSKILYLFFTKILECGSNANNKRVPYLFLDLPLNRLGSFLRGYFEGDGSVSLSDRRVTCDTVSEGLLADLEFCLSRFGIFSKKYEYEKEPGPAVKEFYIRKNRKIPKFKITKLIIGSDFVDVFGKIAFLSNTKNKILNFHLNKKGVGMRIDKDKDFIYDPITSIDEIGEKESYCLSIDTKEHLVVTNSILSKQCDGDEVAVMLLTDALLNFSKKYLPSHRGATQDAPLVLTSILAPSEVDDMVLNMDIAWKYPLEFYKACEDYKMPWDVKIEKFGDVLETERQFEKMGFTHHTSDINEGVNFSAYKALPTMEEKVRGQMRLAEKIRAVDEVDVARLVIERHFIRDLKGNLRKFSMQQFRCVNCNEKYRRPPLAGHCLKCKGKIIFTISEGSVIKYLEPCISLANKYNLPPYLKQSLELLQQRIESVFGKDKELQTGLGSWFG